MQSRTKTADWNFRFFLAESLCLRAEPHPKLQCIVVLWNNSQIKKTTGLLYSIFTTIHQRYRDTHRHAQTKEQSDKPEPDNHDRKWKPGVLRAAAPRTLTLASPAIGHWPRVPLNFYQSTFSTSL